jgi:5-(carboxyamino)imidazole ribonucleotide synthase
MPRCDPHRGRVRATARLTAPTVGIIGAGQLARMTTQAAISLAVDVKVLAADGSDPACIAATAVEVGDPGDLNAIRRFAEGCDVVTFDHERVDIAAIAALEADGTRVHPSSTTLRFSDKAHQRNEFSAHGLPVPPFNIVNSMSGIDAFAATHGWPVVAKTAVGGYDGRGVFVLADMDEAREVLGPLVGHRIVLEPLLDIQTEIAVIVASRPSGEAVAYPVVETIQRDGICIETVTPADIDPCVATGATELAISIAELTGAVGILAVEFFVTPDGLLINELAPRPHNSGHWTIEGSVTSQFENHLRGILDWPLGATTTTAPAVAMANILGDDSPVDPASRLPLALEVEAAHIHLYAKATRPGRKLGHVTATGPDRATALGRVRAAVVALGAQPEPSTTTGVIQ